MRETRLYLPRCLFGRLPCGPIRALRAEPFGERAPRHELNQNCQEDERRSL